MAYASWFSDYTSPGMRYLNILGTPNYRRRILDATTATTIFTAYSAVKIDGGRAAGGWDRESTTWLGGRTKP